MPPYVIPILHFNGKYDVLHLVLAANMSVRMYVCIYIYIIISINVLVVVMLAARAMMAMAVP